MSKSKKESQDSKIESNYQKLEHREHALKRPGMYIGSIHHEEEPMYIYDKKEKRMVKKTIKFVPGLYKILDELTCNIADHWVRMEDKIKKQKEIRAGTANKKSEDYKDIEKKGKYYPVKNIKVSVDKENQEVTFYNDGDGIDIVLHKKYDIYIPELIFGNLLSGTNYSETKERIVGGQNGLGAKLANIFSTKFTITTVDHRRKLKYTQTFSDHMKEIGKPEITENCTEKPYTEITVKPDLSIFKLKSFESDDTMSLLHKRIVDISAMTPKDVSVYYNDELIPIKSFEKYIDLYIGTKSENKRVYYKVNNRWEIGISLSPDSKFEHISFVNGICTYKGGKHVEHVYTVLANRISKYINEKETKSEKRRNRGKWGMCKQCR